MWGLLGAPARAQVQDDDQTPYICESIDHGLSRVIAEEWAHDDVLAALPE